MGILETAIPNLWTIKGGYLQLWNSIASKLKDVRLQSDDIKINRSSNGVSVTTKSGQTEVFDKLFIATPLKSLNYLDTLESERQIFSKILHYDYYTIIAKVKNLPKMGLYMLKKYCNDVPRYFQCAFYKSKYFQGKNRLGIV